jgi:hypothetical protein
MISGARPTLGKTSDVRTGSWLCENAKTLNRDRRSYSSKTVLVAQRASGFNLEVELKNIILRRVSILSFYTAKVITGSQRTPRPRPPLLAQLVAATQALTRSAGVSRRRL